MSSHDLDIGGRGIVIAPFRAAEAAALAHLGDDASVARMLPSIRLPFDAPAASARIAASRWRGRPGFRAAIRETGGDLLGEIGLGPEDPPSLMIWLGAPHRGRGHGRAAIEAFLGFVFARLAPAAVAAECYLDNPASLRLLARQGFVATGDAVEATPPLREGPMRYRVLRLDRAAWEARA